MSAPIAGPDRIRELFALLADGTIAAHTLEGATLTLGVELGESWLTVSLEGLDELSFLASPGRRAGGPRLLSDPEEVFDAELDVESAHLVDGAVEVVCRRQAPDLPEAGGRLRLRAPTARVTSEDGRALSLEELRALLPDPADD